MKSKAQAVRHDQSRLAEEQPMPVTASANGDGAEARTDCRRTETVMKRGRADQDQIRGKEFPKTMFANQNDPGGHWENISEWGYTPRGIP